MYWYLKTEILPFNKKTRKQQKKFCASWFFIAGYLLRGYGTKKWIYIALTG
jgi:hypothetical protein